MDLSKKYDNTLKYFYCSPFWSRCCCMDLPKGYNTTLDLNWCAYFCCCFVWWSKYLVLCLESMPAAVSLVSFVVIPCCLALVLSAPSVLAGCLQLLSFDGSRGGIFYDIPLTLYDLLVLLRFHVHYCVVGGFWVVFRVIPPTFSFLFYWLLGGVKFAPSHSWGWPNPFIVHLAHLWLVVFAQGGFVFVGWTSLLVCLEGRVASWWKVSVFTMQRKWWCLTLFSCSLKGYFYTTALPVPQTISITARDRRYPTSMASINDPHIDNLHA